MNDSHPSILFVDDEQLILDSLKRLVQGEDWNCKFAQSADLALELMKNQRFDLIVSDIIMPEKNGFALLSEVKKLYPWTVRIFLTAFARQETVIQALTDGCTQQIIPKPWIDQELKEIIHSALRQSLQQRKHSPEFQALINSIPLLPPLPSSYSQVRSCIVGDEVDIDKMAALISRDVAMSTTLLHWANSALFGQRFQVGTVKKAIVVLGTNIVESLILSAAIHRAIAAHAPSSDSFDQQGFQHHSMATAIIARQLIKILYSSDTEKQDRAFIAGLLHDIGKFAAASYFSKQFSAAVKKAEQEDSCLTEAEIKIFGVSHTELGSFLAEWWALPPFIVKAVTWHHNPLSTPIERDVVDAVHVANLLSYQFDFGSADHTRRHEVLQECWDKFYLTEEGMEILRVETEQLLQVLCT